MRILALIIFAYCMVYVALNLSGCTADTPPVHAKPAVGGLTQMTMAPWTRFS
jgi:hypothetical protein